MTKSELATYIISEKGKPSYPYSDDDFVIKHHIRAVLFEHVHITDLHIDECREASETYDEFVERCRPLAQSDTRDWLNEAKRRPAKGRTRRRFR